LTMIFSVGLIRDALIYKEATDDIREGNYLSATASFEKLDGFRDSETLKVYCEIMSEYDSENFVSIYHCYRGLSKLELDNKALNDVITRTTTEVETLYNHYDVSLSAK
ncbi:MAG: hypothetical protein IKU19_06275, partial [Clostridia bacterium]|nr:hypothetical protein [Clostridia bacterium]